MRPLQSSLEWSHMDYPNGCKNGARGVSLKCREVFALDGEGNVRLPVDVAFFKLFESCVPINERL